MRSVAFSPDGKSIVSGSEDIKVWDAGASALIPLNPQPKTDGSPACGSVPGAQGGEAERAQRSGELRGLLARRQDHRLGLHRQDAQSLGCGCVDPDTSNPQTPNLTAPVLAAASLELKAEKKNAHGADQYGRTGVLSVGYSPDGAKVVSSGYDGTLKVWDAGAWAPTPSNPYAQT